MRFRLICLVVTTTAFAGSVSPAQAHDVLYVERPAGPFQLGPRPSDIVAGDFLHGDTYDEFIVTLRGSDEIQYFDNDYGRLKRIAAAATGDQPVDLAVFDQGLADNFIAVAATGSDEVRVFREGGSDDSPDLDDFEVVATDDRPVAVGLAQYFSSGSWVPELAVAARGSDEVSLYREDDGKYARQGRFSFGPDPVDIAMARGFNQASLSFVSRGAGQVTIVDGWRPEGPYDPRTMDVGTAPSAAVMADLIANDFGDSEVAVVNEGSDDVTVIDAPNDTRDYAVVGTFPAGSSPSDITAGRFDERPGLDLAVTSFETDTLTLLSNDGAGRFEEGPTFRTGRNPVAVTGIRASRYFNSDIAVLNEGTNDMTLFLRHAPGKCQAGPAWLRPGSDIDDVITGRRDPDRIDAGDGEDIVGSGGGGDCVFGGPGDDELDTGGAEDLVLGNGGNDTIIAGGQLDRVFGGPGDDRLRSDASARYGEFGPTWGRDRVRGGPGRDLIAPGFGSDRVYGDAGNDRIRINDGWRDVVDCGRGRDIVVGDPVDRLRRCERISLPR